MAALSNVFLYRHSDPTLLAFPKGSFLYPVGNGDGERHGDRIHLILTTKMTLYYQMGFFSGR